MKTANIESGYAWLRLAAALGLSMVGGLGMYIGVVAMPAFLADFGVNRGDASMPFTMVMFGFGVGGIIIGRQYRRARGILSAGRARRSLLDVRRDTCLDRLFRLWIRIRAAGRRHFQVV